MLARISTTNILARLTPKTRSVQAVNGNFYNNALYFGNPNNTPHYSGEPYAHVSLVASGTIYNRSVFDNSSSLGTGFANDNHSAYFGSVTVPGAIVFISTTQAAIPEPGTSAILTVGLLLADTRNRLDLITPASPRGWGCMTPHQMVCHLSEAFRLALGERTASPGQAPLPPAILHRFADPHLSAFAPHPVFGAMNSWGWRRWGFLHTEHHFRQIGL